MLLRHLFSHEVYLQPKDITMYKTSNRPFEKLGSIVVFIFFKCPIPALIVYFHYLKTFLAQQKWDFNSSRRSRRQAPSPHFHVIILVQLSSGI